MSGPYRSDVKPTVFRGPSTCFVLSEVIGVAKSGKAFAPVLDIYLRTGTTVTRSFPSGEEGEEACRLRFQELADALVEANR